MYTLHFDPALSQFYLDHPLSVPGDLGAGHLWAWGRRSPTVLHGIAPAVAADLQSTQLLAASALDLLCPPHQMALMGFHLVLISFCCTTVPVTLCQKMPPTRNRGIKQVCALYFKVVP